MSNKDKKPTATVDGTNVPVDADVKDVEEPKEQGKEETENKEAEKPKEEGKKVKKINWKKILKWTGISLGAAATGVAGGVAGFKFHESRAKAPEFSKTPQPAPQPQLNSNPDPSRFVNPNLGNVVTDAVKDLVD